jgi:hypothetical protein
MKTELCLICLENKNNIIQLLHIKPIGYTSSHKMCNDCLFFFNKDVCPFCRGNIILPKNNNKNKINILFLQRFVILLYLLYVLYAYIFIILFICINDYFGYLVYFF